ncbi:MAG: glucoamylase family protein, partial [Bacteriovorax sp.]|nr:glucoamylase family protein [Bacteriovorax sp.]
LMMNVVFLPYNSWVQIDAIVRTFVRLSVTKRKLLEWTTSAQTKFNTNLCLYSFLKRMLKMQIVILGIFTVLLVINPFHWKVMVGLFSLWWLSPFIAWKISQPPKEIKNVSLSDADIFLLRNNARKIWRFFSEFVTLQENFLPPDNFQEDPETVIAHRSSPTNFGLYLMSVITARDFGWIGLHELVERLELSLGSMKNLPKYNGHFYNWYDTTNCHALEPRYISSVDNGNLAGHLLAVAQSCEEVAGSVGVEIDYSAKILFGIQDSLRLLLQAFSLQSDFYISSVLNDLVKLLSTPYVQIKDKNGHWELLLSRSTYLLDEIKLYSGKRHRNENNEVHNWAILIEAEIKSHARDFYQFKSSNSTQDIQERLISIANLCREMFYEMDFSFLYDTTRKLFSIGYRMSDASLDDSYYDLLASEARLLSFIAIAKGDVPPEHWFRLGRALTSIQKGAALISWSGSMFEYLMPSLVMHTPSSSLLEQTCRLIVKKQIQYGKDKSIPWGMSESAYNARDLHMTYQYSNFGVPDLAFKRGMSKDLVISPYATILAGMYDPSGAVKNLRRLLKLNAEGDYGFYESIDFTKTRIPEKCEFVLVKTYMAHHQGMSLVSISNMIHDSLMLKRFHREPIIQASELLLHERIPQNIAIAKTRMESVKVEHSNSGSENTFRQYFSPHYKVPRAHLLSNGEYSVMLTSAGSGYSQFKNLAVNRWREDVTRDNWGNFIFLRDIHSDNVWSAGYQPTCVEPEKYEVVFTEDRAKIMRQDFLITSQLEVFISPEDNTEIRRISLNNNALEVKVIELTSYFEVVLNAKEADIAHPSFSNLFVQTEYIPEITTLLASRRPRAQTEESVWMAQVIAVDSNALGDIEYETDRSRFIGRGRSINTPISLETKNLSNTIGSVLDPIMSFRTKVRIEPGSTATVTYSIIMAKSREEVIKLSEKFHEASSYDRASNLAWTQAQVKLHYLGIEHSEANLFQKLANRIIFLDSSLRVSSEILKKNVLNVVNLWAHGISGDYPIVLVCVDDLDQRPLVRQLLRAHEYWDSKGLVVDLIILNEKLNSYSQEFQNSLEALVSASLLTSRRNKTESKGKIFLLRSDIISKDERNLLLSSARVMLEGRLGNLPEQARRMIRKLDKVFSNPQIRTSQAKVSDKIKSIPPLEFYNGLGGFANNGKEYLIHLTNNESTPAPWINVIANPKFGFHVSESGAGSTWAINSRENQLTPWSNDSVCDSTGECFYIFDNDRSELWSPTISPIRVLNAEYLVKHGQGYSQFDLRNQGIHSTLVQYVHKDLTVKISKLTLRNESNFKRNLSITSYVEWVLGFSRSNTSAHLISDYDEQSKSILCYNPWNLEFGRRMAFANILGGNNSWTASRVEFIGRNGNLSRPLALIKNTDFNQLIGAGLDNCAALRKDIILMPNEEITVVMVLGQAENTTEIQSLIEKINNQNIDHILKDVMDEWSNILEKIQVVTPDLS